MAATDSKKWWERFPGVSAAKEQAAGLRKAQNELVTKRDNARVAEGEAANTLRKKNAPNAYDPVIPKGQRVQYGDIPPVKLADAIPAARVDPNKVVRPNDNITLDYTSTPNDFEPGSINEQRQQDAELAERRRSGRLPNPEPATPEVYTASRGASPALERGATRLDSVTTPDQVIVGGKTYPNRAAYEADRALTEAASLVDKVKRGIPVDASKEAIQKAFEMVKSAGAAVGSGQVAATIGSTLGTQAKSFAGAAGNSVPYVSGAPNAPPALESPEITDLKAQEVSLRDALNNPGLSPAQQSEIAAELTTVQRSLASADIDPNAPKMTEIDGQIKPDPRDADFNKGQATTLGNGADRTVAADLDAQIAGFDEPDAPPPISDADIDAQSEQPKAQRTIKERAVDAYGAAKEKVGLGPASGEPKPPKGPGRISKTLRATGGASAILEGADLATKYINNLGDVGFDEANRIAKEGIEDTATEAAAGLGRQATRIDQGKYGEAATAAGDFAIDSAKGFAQLPGSIYDQGGRMGYNLRNALGFGVPESGIYRADPNNPRKVLQGQTTDQTSQEALDDVNAGRVADLEAFDNAPEKAVRDANAQALIDQSRAESGDKGLRSGTQRVVPPSNGSYFINNGAGASGIDGLAGGTGGVAQGQKQFFRDMKPAFPQTSGLRAARAEILNRGKFANGNRFSDNVDGNWAAEMAGARMRANENTTAAYNDRTAASLRGANITANTAANTANEKRYTDLGARLDSTDADIKRNAKTDAFYGFLNEKEQQGGQYNPNSAYARQAGNILRREITDMSDPNVPKAIWNSLAPAFLGGGGMGALQWLNGNLNMGGQFDSMTIDPDGTIRAMSSDGPVKSINLGFIPDADTAVFARQVLENTPEKK